MSKQEDRDFCKIAIQTGRVSEDDAKRCLAYANKLEAEGQRRPRVGTVFVKAKLLGQQDAQRIYAALQKRQGATASPQAAASRAGTSRRQRSSRGRPQERERRRSSSGQKRVSSASMIFSVMSLVALVIMVGIMGALFYASGSNEAATHTASAPVETKAEPEKEKPVVADASTVNPEVLEQLKQNLRQAVLDAQSLVRDDRYGLALGQLKQFNSQNSTYLKLDPYAELHRNLSQEIGKIEERIGKEFDDTVAQAREHAANGKTDRGASILRRLRDQVDDKTATRVDAELEKLQGN